MPLRRSLLVVSERDSFSSLRSHATYRGLAAVAGASEVLLNCGIRLRSILSLIQWSATEIARSILRRYNSLDTEYMLALILKIWSSALRADGLSAPKTSIPKGRN